MKTTKLACLAAVCLFCSGMAAADSTTDPMLELGGDGDAMPFSSTYFTIPEVFTCPSTNLTCTTAQNLTQVFQNVTGSPIGTFTVDDYTPGNLTCSVLEGAPFADCLPIEGGTAIEFFGGTDPTATCEVEEEEETECTGGTFTITFVGFPPGPVTFSGEDTPVPEPATFALILGGIGTLLARKKLMASKPAARF
jgi:hypothetical protein